MLNLTSLYTDESLFEAEPKLVKDGKMYGRRSSPSFAHADIVEKR